jgi:hypothetical protein
MSTQLPILVIAISGVLALTAPASAEAHGRHRFHKPQRQWLVRQHAVEHRFLRDPHHHHLALHRHHRFLHRPFFFHDCRIAHPGVFVWWAFSPGVVVVSQ